MAMVSRRVVRGRQMARGAHRVSFRAQFSGVWIVTIAARHAAGVHAALQKRAPNVILVALLTVGVVLRTAQERRSIVVQEWLSRFVAISNLAAPRMTLCACLDLAVARPRPRANGVPGRRVRPPNYAMPLVEPRDQSLGRVAPSHSIIAHSRRPRDVAGTRTMARFTADAHFGPRRPKLVVLAIVILSYACRVTVGAHVVPVL